MKVRRSKNKKLRLLNIEFSLCTGIKLILVSISNFIDCRCREIPAFKLNIYFSPVSVNTGIESGFHLGLVGPPI